MDVRPIITIIKRQWMYYSPFGGDPVVITLWLCNLRTELRREGRPTYGTHFMPNVRRL